MSNGRPLNGAEVWFAAEHALGVLEAEALSEARAREARDPVFAAEVEAWRTELSPLLEDVGERRPPRRVREAVLASFASRHPAPDAPAIGAARALGLIGFGAVITLLLLIALPDGTLDGARAMLGTR